MDAENIHPVVKKTKIKEKQRNPKKRKKRRLFEKLSALFHPDSLLKKFIHPAYRRLIKRYLDFKECGNPKVSNEQLKKTWQKMSSLNAITSKIRQRVFRDSSRLIPRTPPFYCPRCLLYSKNINKLVAHNCTKKAFEYTNVEKITQLGFRSRVKDSLAVLERVPNPQAIKLTSMATHSFHYELKTCQRPPSLLEIAQKVVNQCHLHYESIVDNSEWNEEKIIEFSNIGREKLKSYSESDVIYSKTGDGVFCTFCNRLFARFYDYDEHLENNESCSYDIQPLEIRVSTASEYPKAGVFIPNVHPESLTNKSEKLNCTKCNEDFENRISLYEHIFECALT